MEVKISASSDRATTPLQAEAQATKLAAILVQRLQLKGAIFLTDNLTLAKALAARAPTDEPGHWQIRAMVQQPRRSRFRCSILQELTTK